MRLIELTPAEKNMNATSGTLALGYAKRAIIQVTMDGNATYEVAVKAPVAVTGTCSKNSCGAVLSDLGAEEFNLGAGQKWAAWRVYNAATAATGTATDKIIAQLQG